ncbi:MAG: anthrax toxin lethal factor-related metalloendopeptidase [Pirellulales bacterium]
MPLNHKLTALLFISCCLAFSLLNSASAAEKSEHYTPIEKQIEGWTVVFDPQLFSEEHKETGEQAIIALANHLQRIKYIVPQDRVKQLQKLRIWMELDNDKLGAMQYHPGRGWLLANGHDPHLVNHVHIPHAKALLSRSTWAKHPYVILHELAHSYHDQVLGFEEPNIIAAYNASKEAGIYEKVMLYTGRTVRHYGLTNNKEYFAECTEAYFGVNDFYPFVRAELKNHDPKMYEVMEKVWGKIR